MRVCRWWMVSLLLKINLFREFSDINQTDEIIACHIHSCKVPWCAITENEFPTFKLNSALCINYTWRPNDQRFSCVSHCASLFSKSFVMHWNMLRRIIRWLESHTNIYFFLYCGGRQKGFFHEPQPFDWLRTGELYLHFILRKEQRKMHCNLDRRQYHSIIQRILCAQAHDCVWLLCSHRTHEIHSQ